jgi:hypothetical protein
MVALWVRYDWDTETIWSDKAQRRGNSSPSTEQSGSRMAPENDSHRSAEPSAGAP